MADPTPREAPDVAEMEEKLMMMARRSIERQAGVERFARRMALAAYLLALAVPALAIGGILYAVIAEALS